MDILVKKLNDVYIQIECDDGIAYELSDYFSYFAKNYRHMPKVKAGIWDGRIRLFDLRNNTLYYGLLDKLAYFAKSRAYTIDVQGNFLDSKPKITFDVNSYNPPFTPYDYQEKAIDIILNKKRRIVLSPTSCHQKGDKIIMSCGELKNVENIKVGEFIISPDGTQKEVLKTFKGSDNLFEINPKNNRKSVTVTSNHILHIKHTPSGKKYGLDNQIHDVSIKDFMNKSKYYKHTAKLMYNDMPFEFMNDVDCILSPYFIGIYLGDGTSQYCQVTSIDDEIINACHDECIKFDMKCTTKNMHHRMTYKQGAYNPIFQEFKKLNMIFGCYDNRIMCHERFIPDILHTQSIDYRYELLAGLMDSDGHLSNGTYYEFTSKSEILADGVIRLATSLGLVCSSSTKTINGVEYYRVNIMGNIQKIPCRVHRKTLVKLDVKRNPYTSGFDVRSKGFGEYYGIQVEDSLYIHESGMINHNSGKSFIIYGSMRYLVEQSNQILLVVPTTSLVEQMVKDFKEYGWKADDFCHKIYSGKDKMSDKPVIVTTWQSVYKLGKAWFDRFDAVYVDEAHLATAQSIKGIMEKLEHCEYRIGLTGTLEDTQAHKIMLQGLFGKVYITVTTKELMDRNIVAQLKINALIFNHSDEDCKIVSKMKYEPEVKTIINNDRRNKFICNLAQKQKGNTLVLYRYVEKHGEPLYKMLSGMNQGPDDRMIFFVHGDTSVATREEIREITELHNNVIIVASYGTFSTGINIKNLDNVIFAHPYKSKIKNLQSIGRILRKATADAKATLFDIVDNYCWKTKKNTTYKHFLERLGIYEKEQFEYKIIELNL